MNYALIGYGKMGRAVEIEAARRGHERTVIVTRGRWTKRSLSGVDVAFEFTEPASAEQNVIALLALGIPVVCGTTGWDPGSTRVQRAARDGGAGLIAAPNFSVGMGLFFRITSAAVRALRSAEGYDPYVLEFHHRQKLDAPSGTALRLAQLVQSGDPRIRSIHQGPLLGKLPEGAMHVTGVRAGHEPGTHTVGFEGEHDSIQLTHRARGRAGAALGAVLAAEWLPNRPGIHSFDEVLDALVEGTPPAPARAARTKAKKKERMP